MSYSITLSELLRDVADVATGENRKITGISIDSRTVGHGHLFIGMPGVTSDGRQYIDAAIKAGAVALLMETGDGYEVPAVGVPVFRVPKARSIVGLLLNRFYDFPSQKLTVIGFTGTNGKTTCSQLLSRVLDGPRHRCAVIGTLGSGYPDAQDPGIHTTPDIVSLHRMLAGFADSGASAVCMEVSSHALEQGRVDGIAFDVAVFTNLTRDHLDYHGDMDRYAAAKSRLFVVEGLKYAVVNLDDPYGRRLAEKTANVTVIGYGIQAGDIRADNIRATATGMSMTLVIDRERHDIHSGLYGQFNISNLLAVAGVLHALDWTPTDIATGLSGLTPVPGRMEPFRGGGGTPVVIVDYAHSPDALEQALTALRPHAEGQLWCLFGCGGDRDTGKRPLMGRIASELADKVVLTDDNPRTESPEKIIRDIEEGMESPHQVIQPREQAVRRVIEAAGTRDLVLIAGKGHEDYQEIDGQRAHYSDRELVQQILGEVA